MLSKLKNFRVILSSTEFPKTSQFCFYVDDADGKRLATVYPLNDGRASEQEDEEDIGPYAKKCGNTICVTHLERINNHRFLLKITFGNGQQDILYDIDVDGIPRKREVGYHLSLRPCPMTQLQSLGKVHIYDLHSPFLTPRTYNVGQHVCWKFVLISPTTYADRDGVFDLETGQMVFSLPSDPQRSTRSHSQIYPFNDDVFVFQRRTGTGKVQIEILETKTGLLNAKYDFWDVYYAEDDGALYGQGGVSKKLVCKDGIYVFEDYKRCRVTVTELLIGSKDPAKDQAVCEILFSQLSLPSVLVEQVWNYLYSFIYG